jgi:hypothetical protein
VLELYPNTTPPGAVAAEELIEVEHQISLLQLRASKLAAEVAETDYADRHGYNCTGDWMRFNCHLIDRIAWDRIAVGRTLARMPESHQAMQEGEIGFTHLAIMARTFEAVGEAFDEKKLLKLARDNSPGGFFRKCEHYRHAVDAKRYAAEQAEQTEQRKLNFSSGEGGWMWISCVLDPIGGAAVRNAIEALARPSGAHDYREREQRLADALVELATTGGNQRVQMQVTSSLETLVGLIGAPGAEAEFSLPISSKTVQRWACDCSITRVLMQDSVIIDVGRAERTIKGPKRRALNARDQHCQWAECDRPASKCDGHHILHWAHGGGDELENLVLLCGRHHWKVHEGGWQLVKTDDGRIVPIGPITMFGLPRGPD